MTRILFTVTLLASAALAGCNNDTTASDENSAAANEVAAPIVLPPSIAASKAYRCRDNSLVYIDWLSDGTAKVKKSRDDYSAPAVQPDAEGSPLKGARTDATVTVNGQSCKG